MVLPRVGGFLHFHEDTMTTTEKYHEFLQIAHALNTRLGCTPLLFGSLGLSRRLEADLSPDDIDVLLPREFLADRWAELAELMHSLGYALYDLHEHAFGREGLSAAFAELEGLADFAGVDVGAIPILSDTGSSYRLLTLSDYRKVYAASAKDGYRRDKKLKNDRAKLDLIDAALQKDTH